MLDNIFQPHGEMVLLREIEAPKFTASGISLLNDPNKHTKKAEVIAAGDGERSKTTGVRIPLDVVVGDVVHFMAYAGNTEITTPGGDKLILVAHRDIVAKEV